MTPVYPFELFTTRLAIRLATADDVSQILEFYETNRVHLSPFEPVRAAIFYTRDYWLEQVKRNMDEHREQTSLKTFLFLRSDPGRVIGTANLNHIIGGVFHSCFLGYSIGGEEQGRGLMYESLTAMIHHAFHELRIHRISANYIPHNVRSGKLLRRLGFRVEGYARDYLLINGRWEDHILTTLLNESWS